MNFSLNTSHAEWSLLLWIFWALVAVISLLGYLAFLEHPIDIYFDGNLKEVCERYAT
jgi:hypothetical protein